jgi:hypothetical protein
MVGSALLITTPSYPWYAILLVMVVGWGGRVSWLAVAAAGYLAQYAHALALAPSVAQRLGYGLAAASVVVNWWSRRTDPARRAPDDPAFGDRVTGHRTAEDRVTDQLSR